MDNRQPLNISAPGLLDTELKVLQVAVGMLKDDDMDCGLLDDANSNGEIVFIDLDTDVGQSLFPQLRESQVKIVFSTDKKIAGKNTVSLKKPIRVTTLKDILVQICMQIYEYLNKYQENGTQQAQAKSEAKDIPALNGNVFQNLYKAKSAGLCMKMSYAGHPDVFVNGAEKTIFFNGERSEIGKYYSGDQSEICASVLQENELRNSVQNLPPHALDAELWHAGVVSSNGKLLPGQRTDVPVKLKAWPNFSRQGFKPEYFKIAAFMAKQAISIDDLSKVTQVQLDIVIDFFNAAFAVDLIETQTGDAGQQVQERQLSSDRKTLLSKLAQRLKFA
jgi:hypothetical protein